MLIRTEPSFLRMIRSLPDADQEEVLRAIHEPHENARRLKKVTSGRLRPNSWSIRVMNYTYRAVCQRADDVFSWYWVGTREQANGLF